MNLFDRINLSWRDLMDNKADPRVANYPLMSSPMPTLLICLSYVYIVKVKFHNFLIPFHSVIFSTRHFSLLLPSIGVGTTNDGKSKAISTEEYFNCL